MNLLSMRGWMERCWAQRNRARPRQAMLVIAGAMAIGVVSAQASTHAATAAAKQTVAKASKSVVAQAHKLSVAEAHKLSVAEAHKLSVAEATMTNTGFADLTARLLPAVVNISSTQDAKAATPSSSPDVPQFPPDSPFYQFFKDFDDHPSGQGDDGAAEKSVSLGSGFVIDRSGYIVTNNHVIDGADKITVILQDHTTLAATLVGRDVQTDLALLKVKPAQPLPAVAFGDSDAARVGDWAIAIGNPYGLGGTITAGIISARARAINDGGPYDEFFQTDAAINKGNSGGPLFNLAGDVIGINSAIFSPSGGSVGIGFAIPSNIARHVMEELRRYGHVRRGWIGARLQPVNPEIAGALGLPSVEGTILGAVVDDSPAEHAGLKPGDVILAVDGKAIADMRRFRRAIFDIAPGATATIKVLRNGTPKLLKVTLADAAVEDPPATDQASDDGAVPAPVSPVLTKLLGWAIAAPSDALRDRFQLSESDGVVVVEAGKTPVTMGGPFQPGDVIVEASGTTLHKPRDLSVRLAQLRKSGRKSVLLLVDRNGDLRYVTVKLA